MQDGHEFGVFSEYGQLHEVMVGRLDDFAYPAWNPNIRYLSGEIAELLRGAEGDAINVRERAPEIFERTSRQLENVAATFESHGVKVCRPRPFTEEEKVYLSYLQGGHSLLYPADPVFVLGKHVIETCIRRPFRRKEAWAIRDVIMPSIEADPEMRHVAMPRAQPLKAKGEGPGPFLEGGDLIIYGDTVMVGNGVLCSNDKGCAWLRRYLEPSGYKIHPVEIRGAYLHLLGVMCLLREGLAMAYMPALGNQLPDPVKDWDVIQITEDECRALATVGMNLDQTRHMIDSRFTRIIAELERRGMEPVPMPMEHLSDWGGAVRCVTLPLARAAE